MAGGAEGRRGTLLLLLLLVLVAATHAFVVSGRTPSISSCRRHVTTMRATRPPSSSNDAPEPSSSASSRVSRGEWVQGIAGVAGVGAVALGGERAVRAAQEEQQVLVRRPVLSERLYDTHRRSYLPVDQTLLKSNRALDHPVVCVGEVHDDDQNHYAEYAILKAVHARHLAQGSPGPLAVGMEMFYRQHQPLLDDFVFGGADARSLAALKQDTRWDETWGWKLSYYSKILNYARMHGIRLCGLNVPQPVVKVVSLMGLEKVPANLKSRLPEVDLNNKAHRESFMSMMRYFSAMHGGGGGASMGPHGGGMSEESLVKMYEAQTLWDEYMAESASNYIRDSGAGARMVLMAGSNHIQNRYGVPDRITRRLGVPVFTVLPISVPFDAVSGLPAVDDEGIRELLLPSYADWLYFVEKEA